MPSVAVVAADLPRVTPRSGHPDPGPPRPPVGLYLHVPFCVSLCPYCDFVVLTGRATPGPAARIPAFLDGAARRA